MSSPLFNEYELRILKWGDKMAPITGAKTQRVTHIGDLTHKRAKSMHELGATAAEIAYEANVTTSAVNTWLRRHVNVNHKDLAHVTASV